VDYVRKDDSAHRMRTVDQSVHAAQRAELDYLLVASTSRLSVVAVRLLTGRKHQIRLQFADRDHPILGDRKYCSKRAFSAGVALHSWRLQITHPTRRKRCTWFAPLPSSWDSLTKTLPSQQELAAMVEEGFGLRSLESPAEESADDPKEAT
jgi:23S rRNA pseudouridine1911/1915/1917 synthase